MIRNARWFHRRFVADELEGEAGEGTVEARQLRQTALHPEDLKCGEDSSTDPTRMGTGPLAPQACKILHSINVFRQTSNEKYI